MDLFDAIATRRTIPRLTDPAPTPAELDRILAAGAQAPDHGRLTPWRFLILQGDTRARLGDALAALRRARDPDCTPEAAAAERDKAFRAPLILVVAAHLTPAHAIPEIDQIMAVAACTQNIVLAATALGFAANWKTGPAAAAPAVRRALGFDPVDVIAAFVYLGTPAAAPPPKPATLKSPAWLKNDVRTL